MLRAKQEKDRIRSGEKAFVSVATGAEVTFPWKGRELRGVERDASQGDSRTAAGCVGCGTESATMHPVTGPSPLPLEPFLAVTATQLLQHTVCRCPEWL